MLGWHIKILRSYYNLTSMSTPAGISIDINASTVAWFGDNTSITLLWVLISNCSLESLCLCGERKIVMISFSVGSGIGPDTSDPVFLATSTIFAAACSSTTWS